MHQGDGHPTLLKTGPDHLLPRLFGHSEEPSHHTGIVPDSFWERFVWRESIIFIVHVGVSGVLRWEREDIISMPEWQDHDEEPT